MDHPLRVTLASLLARDPLFILATGHGVHSLFFLQGRGTFEKDPSVFVIAAESCLSFTPHFFSSPFSNGTS